MFFDAPENPSSLKKIVYLIISIILGLLLGTIASCLIEIGYLGWVSGRVDLPTLIKSYTILRWIQGIILALSAVGSFFLGRFWWQKVYIEKVWAKGRE